MAEHGKLLVSGATGTVGQQVVKPLREDLIALGVFSLRSAVRC
jgi:uncharacterized protein YbjT (DUF2867 family)